MHLTAYHPRVSDDALKVLTNVIRTLIPPRRRKYPLTFIVAAILHRIDNGAKWRSLDSGELPWHVAYDYFRRWSRDYVIETANYLIVNMLRFLEAMARTVLGAPSPAANPGPPTLVVIDAVSLRSRVWGRREDHGFDGYKRVKGVKRHAGTDARGHLLACVGSGAGANDGTRAPEVVAVARALGYAELTDALGDGAYGSPRVQRACAALGVRLTSTTVPEAKRLKASGFVPIPKRWVRERTFAHLGFARGFAASHERLTRHVEAVAMWAHVGLALRQIEKR